MCYNVYCHGIFRKKVTLNQTLELSFNPFMPSGRFYLNSLDRFISYIGGVWLVFIIAMFCRNSELNANRADHGQTPRSAASDLGLHCLSMSLLWDARHKWVNM